MCGILGIIGRVERERFDRALDRLAHRGPDGRGVWQSPVDPVVLGHRRLAILDLKPTGFQPMTRGDLVITFNGEIYNFLEIRREIESAGEVFVSESDTEVLLAAFLRWGPACLDRLNGMWAFAIWNQATRRLFLARDRFGKKPLFYAFCDGTFIFGSEMKAIIALTGEARPSGSFPWMVAHPFEYETSEFCLVEGIRRLPAGSWAELDLDDVARRELAPVRYWNTLDRLEEVPADYGAQVERFRELFVDACRLRMRSDVAIGTALSGGIDSSAVACTMAHLAAGDSGARIAPEWQHSFVATFPGTPLDERNFAESVVQHIGARGHYLPIDPIASLDRLDQDVYLFEEIYPTSPMPMMSLYGMVREHGVAVTIDGHGADELLVGYDGFRHALDDAFFDAESFNHVLEICGLPSGGFRRRIGALKALHGGGRGLLRFLAARILAPRRDDPLRGRLGYLNSELDRCFHHAMLPTLLRNYDRYSMANGVEIRMPFLDHRLVTYAFSLPWQSKAPLSSPYTKAILRDAVGGWMPELVRRRRSKIGFNTPFVDWMKGPWREYFLDTIRSSAFLNCALLDPRAVGREIDTVIAKDVSADRADRAWTALMPFLWERAFLKRALVEENGSAMLPA